VTYKQRTVHYSLFIWIKNAWIYLSFRYLSTTGNIHTWTSTQE